MSSKNDAKLLPFFESTKLFGKKAINFYKMMNVVYKLSFPL